MAPPGSKGEPCPDCGRRKWRIESGLRFCRHCGHQAEGFIQYDVEDDVLPGQRVEVARKQKDVRERERKHLSGQKGKELYLEALQLVLRRQVSWLVRDKGVIPQLETVVRDLWDLRIRGFPEPTEETEDDTLSFFSSQAASTDGESEGETRSTVRTRAQSWDTGGASRWPMPRVIDTLALCYLGCLLLRVPVSIASIHRWANNGNIPYRTAYFTLPEEIRARMPAEYTKALKEPGRIGVLDTTLHNAIYDLACSFHLNYNLCNPEDPSLNFVVILIELSRALALPVECVVVAMHISDLLQLDHHLPVGKSRLLVVDHPEIRLMAVLLVAAKICFPLDGNGDPSTTTEWLRTVPALDWKHWLRAFRENTAPVPLFRHERYKSMNIVDIAQMSAPDLAEYLGYLTVMDSYEDENLVSAFFPKPRVPESEPPIRELTFGEETRRIRAILRQSEQVVPNIGPHAATMGYTSYENVASLTEDAKALYQIAAKTAGTSLPELTRAVSSVERQLQDFAKTSLRQGKQAEETHI